MKGMTAWLKRMQTPWLAAVLLILLGADMVWMYEGRSGVGRFFRTSAAERIALFQSGKDYYFLRSGDDLTSLFVDGESADRFASAVKNQPESVLNVYLAPRACIAAWADIFEERVVGVSWMDGSAADDATRERAVRGIAAEFAAAGDAERASELSAKPFGTRRVLWWGVLHSAAAIVAIAGAAVSLGGVPRWVRALRRQPWQCRACGYDLRGSDGVKCSECGANRRGTTA